MFRNLFKKIDTSISLYGFVNGEVVQIENVPDPVFSQKMMGDGIAIQPSEGMIYAPCSGEVIMVADTKHAIGIKTQDGVEILLHIGLDTVALKGEGLEIFCKIGDQVEAHQKIAEISQDLLINPNINTISMLIFTNLCDYHITNRSHGMIQFDQKLLEIEK